MHPFYLILFIAFSSFHCHVFGQKTAKPESISFAQGIAAGRSRILISAETYIKEKKYKKVIALLESRAISDRLVGAILCQKLHDNGEITLTQHQKEKIKKIQQSEDQLTFSSGCTCQSILSLEDYFEGKYSCNFRQSMSDWMEEIIN